MEKLPAAPSGFNALSPQQQEAHRAKIGVRAQAILGQFWRDDDTPDAIQALEIEGWMDVLENCSHSEIRDAWRDYQKSGPRTQSGKLYKPDAGALYRIILSKKPKLRIVLPSERSESAHPAEERVSKEQAEEIMAKAGFRPRKFGEAK